MYKVVYKDLIIDILDRVTYIRYLSRQNKIVATDKTSAHGFYGRDGQTIYLFERVKCPKNKDWKNVKLIKITQYEYDKLARELASENSVTSDLAKLNETRSAKLAELSQSCNAAITEGIFIKLSDNKYHGFRLTTEDQLNLMTIEQQLLSGFETFIYHETGKPCEIYLAEDMRTIITAANKHKEYHTTYYNILKYCINNIYNIKRIAAISYGDDLLKYDLPDNLKQLLEMIDYE